MPGTLLVSPIVSEATRTGKAHKAVAAGVTAILVMNWSITAALAACGAGALGGGSGGPPSISSTEASTTQVLDEIRRRQQQAQQGTQVASYETAGGGAAASGGGGAAPAAKSAASSGGAAPKPVYKTAKAASYQPSGGSADYGPAVSQSGPQMASWAQGYLDYEHHDDIAPGTNANRARKMNTAGYLSGTDWTWANPYTQHMFQLGVFSGYQASFIKLSDTATQQNSRADMDGAMLGAYMAGAQGKFSYNLAFKADIFDLDTSSTLTGACAGQATGGASVNNYTIAGSMAYRHELGGNRWFEPTAGFQYTITDYGSDQFTVSGGANGGRLGLEDGTVLRLLAGARVGQSGILENGGILTVAAGAFLYSDVSITGFAFTPSNPGIEDPVLVTDEGKLRAMGQVITTIDYANGWSWWLSGEVRGGEDYFGATGRTGARLNW